MCSCIPQHKCHRCSTGADESSFHYHKSSSVLLSRVSNYISSCIELVRLLIFVIIIIIFRSQELCTDPCNIGLCNIMLQHEVVVGQRAWQWSSECHHGISVHPNCVFCPLLMPVHTITQLSPLGTMLTLAKNSPYTMSMQMSITAMFFDSFDSRSFTYRLLPQLSRVGLRQSCMQRSRMWRMDGIFTNS